MPPPPTCMGSAWGKCSGMVNILIPHWVGIGGAGIDLFNEGSYCVQVASCHEYCTGSCHEYCTCAHLRQNQTVFIVLFEEFLVKK